MELKVKVINPRISLNDKHSDLSKLNLNISIKHFVKNDFALQSGEIGIFKTEIKQLVELVNQIQRSPYLFFAKNKTIFAASKSLS